MVIRLRRVVLALLILLLLVVLGAWALFRGSVPRLDGTLVLPGVSAPVTIQRDHLGVVTIDAANEIDAMHALGYIHAQERFFEMDLMRRSAAGELAELFGPIALETDKQRRLHRLRTRVSENLASIAGDKMPALKAYVDGVNAGLANLEVRPWPYLLLRTQPRPWQLEDSPLVGYAMYFDLQDSGNVRELALSKIKRVVPPALYALLERDGTSWDAPLQGVPRGDAVLPDAKTLDLRTLPTPTRHRPFAGLLPASREIGSNNFAVSGALTNDGRAIVADDMHLGLRVPNIWFRARLRYADARAVDGRVNVSGFTLPGLPLVVVGSNGHVAWGFTNSYADVADWAPASNAYAAVYHEKILIHGQPAQTLLVRQTSWGPILDQMHGRARGQPLALRWTAQLPGSLNLQLMDFVTAADLDTMLPLAAKVGIPSQNLVAVDAHGRQAWMLIGRLPQRTTDWRTWQVATPIRDPASHRLWTANNRTLDGPALAQVGDAGYALGARAQQIRNDLFARKHFSERDLLAIQLDDRAIFLQRWWQLLHAQALRADTPALHVLAAAAAAWPERASTDSTSYRIVRAWRLAVNARLLDGLTAPAQQVLGDEFAMPDLPQFEGVAWPLVTQQPDNLLSRRFVSWNALFEDAAKEVRDQLKKNGNVSQRTWGERNIARICHPLAMALPTFAKGLLCMPPDELPGDSNMPRVAAPDFGASERMVVSPGHDADGLIEMPSGQSGHPLSPYWGAGHEDWVHGRATPFLPGKTLHTLRLMPFR
jgi:penicillin amidase